MYCTTNIFSFHFLEYGGMTSKRFKNLKLTRQSIFIQEIPENIVC
jgi:hypothetical protein